jgi:dUTP pyrophosphatase
MIIQLDYRGSIKARFKYIKDTKKYEIGERCCQLIILSVPSIEVEIVKELSSTERQEGGFGSTGQKIDEIA